MRFLHGLVFAAFACSFSIAAAASYELTCVARTRASFPAASVPYTFVLDTSSNKVTELLGKEVSNVFSVRNAGNQDGVYFGDYILMGNHVYFMFDINLDEIVQLVFVGDDRIPKVLTGQCAKRNWTTNSQ